jgi:hypothetical protein
MKFLKSFFTTLSVLFVLLLSHFLTYAAEYDFVLTNSTEVAYTTGNDYTDVIINLTREVKDKKYYFSNTVVILFLYQTLYLITKKI